MNLNLKKNQMRVLCALICSVWAIGMAYASRSNPAQIASDQKAEVKGTIVSRNGELVTVKDKKSGTTTIVDSAWLYVENITTLPTVLVVRFFQLENQIQLIVDLQIAENLPIIEEAPGK
jgi:hypothetical protein